MKEKKKKCILPAKTSFRVRTSRNLNLVRTAPVFGHQTASFKARSVGWYTGVQTATSKITWHTWRVRYRWFSWAFQWRRFQNCFFWIWSKVVQPEKFFNIIVVCRFRFYFFLAGVIFLDFFTGCYILVGISLFCDCKNEIWKSSFNFTFLFVC